MAGGDVEHRAMVSEAHDAVDAIAHGLNVIVGELDYAARNLRRAKEEAEAASRAKTAFLSNVSHEIRTPLSTIMGMSELLASPSITQERREVLRKRIVSNGRALVRLLDDLLDLSKVEADKTEFDMHPVAPLAVAHEVIANLEGEALQKGLSLVVDPTSGDRAIANVDRRRLAQILSNLVVNAIKFTDEGGVVLAVHGRGDVVYIDVSDTGIGLTDAQVRRLFEPFQQADDSISKRYGGTGLGLALSKRLAEGMGGTLAVLKSDVGLGTTFRLTLLASTTHADAQEADAIDERAWGKLAGMRVLLAEDHQDVRTLTAELLRLAGAEVVEVGDGMQAMTAVANDTFDALLMDIRMPRVDGLEATRRLRASGVRVPIVALTADALSEHKSECLAAGCDAYLPKPLDLDRLIDLLAPSRAC